MLQYLPSFILGVSSLAGLSISLFHEGQIVSFLWLLFLLFRKHFLGLFGFILFLFYGFFIANQIDGVEGEIKARFSISQCKLHQSPFYQDLAYVGNLIVDGKKLSCTMYRKMKEPILANQDYWIEGVLKKRGPFDWSIKAKALTPIKNSWSLAEFRFQMKQKLRAFLQKNIPHRSSSTLLFALIGGEVDERILRYQFSRVGLQHILAISGFHFGFLISFLSSSLGLFLSKNLRWGLILALISIYFLFLGASPAIERAWLSSTLFFLLKWLKKDTLPLNLLGFTLFLELLIHPLSAANIGFQLSYLSCFGIFCFFKPLKKILSPVFPQRYFSQINKYPAFDQFLFLASAFFKNSLALSFAVNIAIFPLLLVHFQTFPPISFIYNLFYPQLIGILLFIFLFTACIHLALPIISAPFFYLLTAFAKLASDLVAYPPLCLDHPIYLGKIPTFIIPIYLLVLIGIGCLTDRETSDKMDLFRGGRSSVG